MGKQAGSIFPSFYFYLFKFSRERPLKKLPITIFVFCEIALSKTGTATV